MKVPFVDLPALVRPSREEYLAEFGKILDSGGFIGGPAVADFESAFAKYCGAAHACAVKTGTDARPVEVVDYEQLEAPAVMRRRNRESTVEAMRHSGVELLDIPAFLRRQAD